MTIFRAKRPDGVEPVRIGLYPIFRLAAMCLLAACAPGGGERSTAGTEQPVPAATLEPTYQAMILEQRDPDVPELPFPDNPDPSQCGIPTIWGADTQAWLNGVYEGELIQPIVFLYDSHLRLSIAAKAPHGTEVEILLFQENPVTDYYLVKIKNGQGPGEEGWLPEQFLSFEPVQDG